MKTIKKTVLASMVAAAFASISVNAVELGTFNDTKISFGGFIKAETALSNPDNGDSTIDSQASESRFNFKAEKEHNGNKLAAFIEGDFLGQSANNNHSFRLRHAYIQYNDFTIGQSWSGHFWAGAGAHSDLIDFFGGPRGRLDGAGDQVRRTVVSYKKGGLRITVQDPAATKADYPDLAVNYAIPFQAGHLLTASVTGREIENGDFGSGIALSGKLMLGQNDIRIHAHHGKGLGIYSGVGVNGSFAGGNPDTDSYGVDFEDGKAIAQTGVTVSYRHVFTDKLRGNLSYTQVDIDDAASTKYDSKHINLIYTLMPSLDVGIEFADYSHSYIPTRRLAGNRLELMAKYFF